jgi:hypothetical protein
MGKVCEGAAPGRRRHGRAPPRRRCRRRPRARRRAARRWPPPAPRAALGTPPPAAWCRRRCRCWGGLGFGIEVERLRVCKGLGKRGCGGGRETDASRCGRGKRPQGWRPYTRMHAPPPPPPPPPTPRTPQARTHPRGRDDDATATHRAMLAQYEAYRVPSATVTTPSCARLASSLEADSLRSKRPPDCV